MIPLPRKRTRSSRRGPVRLGWRPLVEAMENRQLLSIAVSTFDDVVDATDSVTSLREAIAQASGDSLEDTIVVPAGTYGLDANLGELRVDDAAGLTIRSRDGTATVDARQGGRVLSVSAGSVVTLAGLAITGGVADVGGGLHNAGALTLDGSSVSGNRAHVRGGGVYNAPTGTLLVLGGEIRGNASYEGGGLLNEASATIAGTYLADNAAESWNGGAVFSLFDTTLHVTNSTLERNSSGGHGGAISSFGETILADCNFLGNTAYFGGGAIDSFIGSLRVDRSVFGENAITSSDDNVASVGGAVFVSSECEATITDSLFRGNSARNGGAIHVNQYGTLLSTDNDFVGNAARHGGGIDQVGRATIVRGTFRENTSSNNGGGIGNIGVLTVDGSLFEDNAGGTWGGGLFSYGAVWGIPSSVDVANATFAGNSARYGGGAFLEATQASVSGGAFSGNLAEVGGGLLLHAATTAIADTSIVGNTAYYVGGGLYNYYGRATISGSTIADNAVISGSGGGVYGYSGGLEISDTAITGNSPGGVSTYYSDVSILGSLVADNLGDGLRIEGGYSVRIGTPGDGNTFTGNSGAGVALVGSVFGAPVRGNAIHSNGGLAIDLGGDGRTANDPYDYDYGPNGLQNHPEINGYSVGDATRVIGTLNSTPDSTFTIDIYADSAANTGVSEGRRYLGSFQVVTDGQGLATFDRVLAAATVAGEMPTATATNWYGETSEFSEFRPIVITRTSGLITSESGAKDTFGVRLAVQPSATVTIPLSVSDGAEGTLSTTSLTFTPANWNVPQVVTVTGRDDAIADGPVAYDVVLGAAVSADPVFSGRAGGTVGVTNLDNDFAPSAVAPLGSLVYEAVLDGVIDASGAFATYTLRVDPGQKITVVVDPLGTDLRPTVELYRVDGKSTLLGGATAGAAGGDAVLPSIATHGQLGANNPGAKTYQIRVGGAGGTTGLFRIRYILNAAVEGEAHGGPANDARSSAQGLASAFLPLASSVGDTPSGPYAGRAAVLGRFDGTDDYYAVTLAAGEWATIAAASRDGGVFLALEDASGALLAMPPAGASPAEQRIEDFVAPAAGTYYVRVWGYGTEYSLVVTRGAAFDDGLNRSIAAARDLNTPELGARRWAMGAITPGGTYDASALAYAFEDIRTTGRAILQGTDDAWHFLNATDLNGFRFTAFGHPNTELYISANGYVNLPIGGGAIAALNRDLVIWGSPDAAVYWQVTGTGDQQRLIVQWNEVAFYGDPGAGSVTFQLVLDEADGSIRINYRDLEVANATYSEGRDAFVGVSGSDSTGNYQYFAVPTGVVPNALVGTGRSTRIAAEPPADYYRIAADGNAMLEIETQTPASATGDFRNALDPIVRLYDAAGNLVASNDNGSPDGRNARLKFKVPKGQGGTYYVTVSASPGTASPTTGEYLLSVKGSRADLPAFGVASTDLPEGSVLSYSPSTLAVDFNDAVLLASIQASDLTVDGVPATGFSIIDGDTVVFTLPEGLGEGSHTVAVAAGAIRDLQGTALAAYTLGFAIDLPMFGNPSYAYAGGFYIRNVVTGDVNGDGLADLASALFYDNAVSVLLGIGDGSFAGPILVPTGAYPLSLALGDVTGDDLVDLVVSLSYDGTWVYPGDGHGGFGAPQPVGGLYDPTDTALADLDGDGAIDVVIASYGSNQVAVILNDGQGGFSQTNLYAGYVPRSVSVADMNGDAFLDLVVGTELDDATYATGGVSILLGDGSGGFGAPTTYAAGGPGSIAAVADFDNDGFPDIAAASAAYGDVAVLRNNGDGTFGAPTLYAAGYGPSSIAAADLDGDALIDLVTTERNGAILVLLNVGGGPFSTPTPYFAGYYLPGDQGPAIADFNGDHLPDIAVADFYSSAVPILFNQSPGSGGMGGLAARTVVPAPAPADAPASGPVVKLRGKGLAPAGTGAPGRGLASSRGASGDGLAAGFGATAPPSALFPSPRPTARRRRKS